MYFGRIVRKWTGTLLTLGATGALLAFVSAVFWWQDLQYSLPTPRPASLHQKSIGTLVDLPSAIRAHITRLRRPVLLHFFNPNCPCSRFNLDHLRLLVQKYRGAVEFVAVLQGEPGDGLIAAFESLQIGIPGTADPEGKIAAALGVYATPQAVIVDRNGRLFYRGNYNLNRYCTNRQTEFVRIGLEAALANEQPLAVTAAASVAYGCPLPSNRRRLQLPAMLTAESE